MAAFGRYRPRPLRLHHPRPNVRRRRRRGHHRHRHRLAGYHVPLSGKVDFRMGASVAPCRSGLRDRLRLYGRSGIRRPRADGSPRRLRLGQRRRLPVSGNPFPRRRDHHDDPGSLSLCLPSRPGRFHGAKRLRSRSKPHPRRRSMAWISRHRPAAGPAGHRHRPGSFLRALCDFDIVSGVAPPAFTTSG